MLHLRFHVKKHEKLQKKREEKGAFDVVVDGSLDDAIKDTPSNLKFGFLHVLYIFFCAEQTADIFKLVIVLVALFFFSKCIQRRLRIITNWLISVYVLYGLPLGKK